MYSVEIKSTTRVYFNTSNQNFNEQFIMSKKNRKKPKRRSSSKSNRHKHQPESKKEAKQSSGKIWKWLGRIVVAIGIVGAIIYFYPNVDLYPETAINPYDPYETPFVVKNIGNIPILDLNIDEIKNIKAQRNLSSENDHFFSLELQTPKLSTNEKTTFMPWHTIRFELPLLISMEIKFKVSFSIFLIPYTFERYFRYIATRNTKGEFQWYARSMAE